MIRFRSFRKNGRPHIQFFFTDANFEFRPWALAEKNPYRFGIIHQEYYRILREYQLIETQLTPDEVLHCAPTARLLAKNPTHGYRWSKTLKDVAAQPLASPSGKVISIEQSSLGMIADGQKV